MIIAFIGDNGHSKEQAAKELIASFTGLHGAVAIDKLSGEDINLANLKEAISTLPFLSARRLVVVRNLSANKELADNIEDIHKSMADTTDLVIIESHLDSRNKYQTNLRALAEIREFNHLQGEELANWVVEQVKKLGGQITGSLANTLIERIGVNHQLLVNELTKLVLYQSQITLETINLLTVRSPQSSIFAMLDAAFDGKTAKALQLYAEQRALGMEPAAILSMIIWQIHILNIVKAANSMPANEIATQAKLSPFVVRKNQAAAKRITNQKLEQMLDLTIETDKMLKQTSVNADDALQSLIMAF
jgi:DNA polymerase-3 subunit delta